MENKTKIAIIGCGNMGEALLDGIIKAEKGYEMVVCEKASGQRLEELGKKYENKVYITQKIDKQAAGSDIFIIAVKPNDVEAALKELMPDKNKIIISIAAGVSIEKLEELVGKDKKIIRAMPNICAKVSEAMTALAKNKNISEDEMNLAIEIFNLVGKAIEVKEDKMDVVTGLSGSSPAFIFQIIEAMSDAGVLAGLDRASAIKMSAQSVLGAAKMVLETGKHPAELKDTVTSPAGTTIEGVFKMEKYGVRAGVIGAIKAAIKKSKKINKNK